MNLKKRLKKFFTLNRSANDGFTLVELIVVIAILGILAGVGTVAYSGYIKKAQTAADEILLDSLNTAFAAACIENNDDINDPDVAPTATLASDGTVASITYQDAFEDYFDMDAKFKVYTSLVFRDGLFEGMADGVEFDYNGHKIVVSQATLDALQSSTYGQKIGAEKLLGEVAGLTTWVMGDDFDAEALLGNTEYMQSFASYLGVENASELTGQELSDAINAAVEGVEMSDDAMVNGLVYWAAENSSNMSVSAATTLLTSGNVYSNLSSDTGEKLAQASMIYGMYTAYVNSDAYTGESVLTDPIQVAKTVGSDSAFKTYVESDVGQADLAAYIAAMGVINDSTGNSAMTIDVLNGGFENDELLKLMEDVLGK